MTDSDPPVVDKAAGELVLIKAASILLQGAAATNDERVANIAAVIITELKKGDILESLLIAFASAASPPPQPTYPTVGVQHVSTPTENRDNSLHSLLQMMQEKK